ncbi:hypothetical protein J2X34_005691 [Rhodococcus sp. BE178]
MSRLNDDGRDQVEQDLMRALLRDRHSDLGDLEIRDVD